MQMHIFFWPVYYNTMNSYISFLFVHSTIKPCPLQRNDTINYILCMVIYLCRYSPSNDYKRDSVNRTRRSDSETLGKISTTLRSSAECKQCQWRIMTNNDTPYSTMLYGSKDIYTITSSITHHRQTHKLNYPIILVLIFYVRLNKRFSQLEAGNQ